MKFLLDTNVISEIVRARPSPAVLDWIENQSPIDLYLSVLSLGEIRKGVENLDVGLKRERLADWLKHDLPNWFEDRVLPIDEKVADRWGGLMANTSRTLPAIDGLLAATALHHNLAIATRNVSDFDLPGLAVANPWTD